MKRAWALSSLSVALMVCLLLGGRAWGENDSAVPSASIEPFPAPSALRPQIDFWKSIFATYSRYQVVIHDTEDLSKIYIVLDFRTLLEQMEGDEVAVQKIKAQQTEQEVQRIRALLLKFHRCGTSCGELNEEEQRIQDLYRTTSASDKFLRGANQLRSQTGLRERFAEGIQISRRYLPEMEDIFRREGVPVELTRLPLIESCFNLRAYSKAKAAGIWQFIPSTGRLYMRIDRVMDERRDPLISTRAAARFLKQNYETLGAWPLAITAYNHGRQGVVNGVKTVGTKDIVEIIRRYRGPRFGFASRNFYPEFLAAIEVERDHEHHFGPLQMEPPLTYEEVELTDFITLKHIAHCANTDITNVLHLNPAFEGAISNGRAYVPRGYRVRVPPGAAQMFQQRYTTLPSHAKWSRQKSEFIIHTVRRGQTLAGIARGYGTTTQTLQRLNGLRRASLIRVGQRLKVPSRDGRPAAERYATAKNTMSARHLFIFHKVRRGQTLASIARRYGTNVSTLRHLNGVRNVKSLQIGQTLRVPSS